MIPKLTSKNTLSHPIASKLFNAAFPYTPHNGMHHLIQYSTLARSADTCFSFDLWHELFRASKHLPRIPAMVLRMKLDRTPGMVFCSTAQKWYDQYCRSSSVDIEMPNMLPTGEFGIGTNTIGVAYYYDQKHGFIVFQVNYNKPKGTYMPKYHYFIWNGKEMFRIVEAAIDYIVLGLEEAEDPDVFFHDFCSLHEKYVNSPAYQEDLEIVPFIVKVEPPAAYYDIYPKLKKGVKYDTKTPIG